MLCEETSNRFVDAKAGGIGYRVFAIQLDHLAEPEVQLVTYCRHGSASGAHGVPGFVSADTADELADALKAAAERARVLAAQKRMEGGAA